MELHKIKLTNFRSIKKCTVVISKIKALVGENNSGKSALLRALNAFFNYEDEKEEFILGHHQYTANSLPRIELCFNKIKNKNDQEEIYEICFNDVLEVSRLSDIKNLKKIKGYNRYYRIRKGDYRIGFEYDGDCLIFMRVLRRDDIYKHFP